MDIPLCEPFIRDEEHQAVQEVLDSGWLAHGPMNEEFEDRFAECVGVDHAISMNSCTSALQLAIEAQDIDGEVLVPSFTWVASVNAIVTAGAQPVFVDIEPGTRNMDPTILEDAVTESTEAIMPVHYGGHPCEMEPISEVAAEHDLAVIEDSAETIGGEYRGQRTGSFGLGCFSFYPTKNITTGEGGILTTNDDDLAERIRALVGHGVSTTTLDRENADQSWYRAASYSGYNYRMSNIHAALGVEQMKRLDELNRRRREHATYLTAAITDINGITPPIERDDARHVYQMYTILTDPEVDRDRFVEALTDNGIGASVHFYPPVHEQPRYEGSGASTTDLPVTEHVSRRIVTLPMFPQLTQDQLDYMIDAVQRAVGEARG